MGENWMWLQLPLNDLTAGSMELWLPLKLFHWFLEPPSNRANFRDYIRCLWECQMPAVIWGRYLLQVLWVSSQPHRGSQGVISRCLRCHWLCHSHTCLLFEPPGRCSGKRSHFKPSEAPRWNSVVVQDLRPLLYKPLNPKPRETLLVSVDFK